MPIHTPINTLLITLVMCGGFSTLALANDLKNHHSPYLAMHGEDPVHWHHWGNTALQKARDQNKPLYISIGYFACHWCHVMHQESFKDPDVAKVLNEHYIPVKVDRELNPVLDKKLIEFVQVTHGVAGWPLNVFMTPEGYPMAGSTYMPREHFHGVLRTVAKHWSSDSSGIKSKAIDLNKQLSGMLGILELTTQKTSIASQVGLFLEKAMEEADDLQGGFGNQKFPHFPQLHALLAMNTRSPDEDIDAFLRLTLDAMTRKGLHDAIGGGFFRYTIDPGWKTPHFEKMLYTNAQLPVLLLKAADYFQEDRYTLSALETIDFMLREMRGHSGFIASLSAVDDTGSEGAFYLFSKETIHRALDKESQRIALALWDLDRHDEFPQGNLPIQADDLTALADELGLAMTVMSAKIKAIKQTLQDYRTQHRSLPKDNKQLSGWNGLVLTALAAALPHRSQYQKTGDQLAQFLLSLWDGERLRRSAASDQNGTLLDYAAVAKGLLEWSQASRQPRFAAVAAAIIDQAWAQFYREMTWRESSDSLLPDQVAQSHIADTPITSPETLLLEASAMLGGKLMDQRIRSVLSLSNRSLNADPFAYASLIAFAQRFQSVKNNTSIQNTATH